MIDESPPAPPAVPEPPPGDRGEWQKIHKLLDALSRCNVTIPVPDHLDLLACDAKIAEREGRPLPPLAPLRREVALLREQFCWAARQAGYSQWLMANELGISQPAVSKILRRVERRVLKRMESEARTVKAKQHVQLEFILDQALQGWRKSTEERIRTVVGPDRHNSTSTTRERRNSAGDPRFLKVALLALQSERRLYGLDNTAKATSPEPATLEASRTEVLKLRGCARCGAGPLEASGASERLSAVISEKIHHAPSAEAVES